jgi:Cu/Ag efflux protein CusF
MARQPVLLLLLAAGLMCVASPPVRSEDSTNQVQSAVDLAREKNRQQRQKSPFAKGTLTDIDFLRHQLKLKTEDGLRTFTYTPRTYIFRAKDKIAVDDLKVGEIIALRFATDTDGVRTIVRLKAYGPPTADEPVPGPPISTNQLPSASP